MRALEAAEKFGTGQERRTSGAKARRIFNQFTARLKSCPDTKPSFSAACLAPEVRFFNLSGKAYLGG
jgi:hypothetical protein